MQKEPDLDDIEVRARLAKGRNWGFMETDPTTVLALVAECRELRRLRGALEFMDTQWGATFLPENILGIAGKLGWKEGT